MRYGIGATAAVSGVLLALATTSLVAIGHASALTPTPRPTSSPTELSETVTATVTPTRLEGTPSPTASLTATPTSDEGHHFPPPPTTPTPNPGLNFWISMAGVPGCNTQHGDTTCNIAPRSTFVIDVHLDPLPPEIPSYAGFDISLQHSGVTPNRDASTNAWPDCVFPAAAYDEYSYEYPDANVVAFGCAVGVPPAGGSTYNGLIGTNSFVCTQSGSVSLVPGVGRTDLVEFDNIANIDAEDIHTSDKLTINCEQSVTLPSTGTAARRNNDVSSVIAIALLAGAAFVALGAWGARRWRA